MDARKRQAQDGPGLNSACVCCGLPYGTGAHSRLQSKKQRPLRRLPDTIVYVKPECAAVLADRLKKGCLLDGICSGCYQKNHKLVKGGAVTSAQVQHHPHGDVSAGPQPLSCTGREAATSEHADMKPGQSSAKQGAAPGPQGHTQVLRSAVRLANPAQVLPATASLTAVVQGQEEQGPIPSGIKEDAALHARKGYEMRAAGLVAQDPPVASLPALHGGHNQPAHALLAGPGPGLLLLQPTYTQVLAAFERGEPLGSGGFGTVKKCLVHGEVVAVKMFTSTDPIKLHANSNKEAANIATFEHPHIIRHIHTAYPLSSPANAPLLVMEYCLEGALCTASREYIPLSAKELVTAMLHVSMALSAMHKRRFVHCDVKPANIFRRADGSTVLGDLGLARPLPESLVLNMSTVIGTKGYTPPEVTDHEGSRTPTSMHNHARALKAKHSRFDLTPAFDVWSQGVVMLELGLKGLPHYSVLHPKDAGTRMKNKEAHERAIARNYGVKRAIDAHMYMTIAYSCITRNPNSRPSVDSIQGSLHKLLNDM